MYNLYLYIKIKIKTPHLTNPSPKKCKVILERGINEHSAIHTPAERGLTNPIAEFESAISIQSPLWLRMDAARYGCDALTAIIISSSTALTAPSTVIAATAPSTTTTTLSPPNRHHFSLLFRKAITHTSPLSIHPLPLMHSELLSFLSLSHYLFIYNYCCY